MSQDGDLKVKVTPEGDAFLYTLDDSGTSTNPMFLASDVDSVKFSSAAQGRARILVIHKDGSFQTFTADGAPADGTNT